VPTIVLRDIGDVLRSLPALIGFHPADSLVLLAIHGTAPVVFRTHPDGCDSRLRALWTMLLDQRQSAETTALIAVTVAPDMDTHTDLIHTIRRLADSDDVPLIAAVWTERIAAGRPWRSYLDPNTGVVGDPDTAPATTHAIYAGKQIHPSRDAVAATLAPTAPAEALQRRTRLIDEYLRTRNTTQLVALTREAIRLARAGHLPDTDETIAELAAALHAGTVRDEALLAMTDGDTLRHAALWHHLVCNLADTDQGLPLTVLAIAQMLHGDSVAASTTVDKALAVRTPNSLPALLRTSIDNGMSPTTLRELLTTAAAHSPS
jgi:hypothetical protein